MQPFSSLAVERFTCDLPTTAATAAAAATAPKPKPKPRHGKQAASKPAAGAAEQQREFVTDAVLYSGAPVWSLDWCPWPANRAPPAAADACDLLALSTHPPGLPRSRVGAPQHGPGALQLWAVPHSGPAASEAAVAASAEAMPRCLGLIQHGGRLAWDVKFCPDPSAVVVGGAAALADGVLEAAANSGGGGGGEQLRLQGVLAAVLGDGSVQVYAVPAMHHLASLAEAGAGASGAAPKQQQERMGQQQKSKQRRPKQQQQADSADEAMPDADEQSEAAAEGHTADASGSSSVAAAAAAAGCSVLDLKPVASLTPDQMGGSLASCCAWLPAAPHNCLLVGCWDGHVAVWRLPTEQGGRYHCVGCGVHG